MSRASVLDHLSALADPTRSRLLLLLERHELTVRELCVVLQLPQSTASRHLRILSDEGWVQSRGEGTRRFYSMVGARLDPAARRLWKVVRDEVARTAGAAHDRHRLDSVLARRRARSQQFFSTSAALWDNMRAEMIGTRVDAIALLSLLDDRWTVGDLGCGTGHVSALLAPCVARVVAVDESSAMLAAARERLTATPNVDLRSGPLEHLPIDDAELDVGILFLVAHFLAAPDLAFAEAARVLRPGGRLLLVDWMPHDREDYALQLGHVWQGFAEEQVTGWLDAAGFESVRYRPLSPDPAAKGPNLFAATARVPS